MLLIACWLECGVAFTAGLHAEPLAVGTETRRFDAGPKAQYLAASPDGSRLLAFGEAGAAVWTAGGQLVTRLEKGPCYLGGAVGFSADGGKVRLVSGAAAWTMGWDAATGKPLPTQMLPEDEFAWRLIAVAWRLMTPRRLPGEGDAAYGERNPGLGLGMAFASAYLHPFNTSTLAVTPDGRRSLVTLSARTMFEQKTPLLSVRVWDAERGAEAWRFTPAAWTRRLYDGCLIVDRAENALADRGTRALAALRPLSWPIARPAAPAATLSSYTRPEDLGWFARAVRLLGRFELHIPLADRLALGSLLYPGGGGEIPAPLSPDGRYLACGGDGVLVCDLVTGRAVRRLPAGGAWAEKVAFDPAGATLLTAGRPQGQLEDGRCVLARFDLATGRKLWTAQAVHGELRSVAFSPNGKFALAVGKYRGVWLWDAEAGKLLGRVGGAGDDAPSDAAFLGGKVATLTPDGDKASLVQVWRLPGR